MYFQFASTARLLARDLNRLALGVHMGTRSLLESAVREVAIASIQANFEAGGAPSETCPCRRARDECPSAGLAALRARPGGGDDRPDAC